MNTFSYMNTMKMISKPPVRYNTLDTHSYFNDNLDLYLLSDKRDRSNLSVRYNFNLEKAKLVSLSELVKRIKNNVTGNTNIIELKMRNGMLLPYISGDQFEYFSDEISDVTLSEISKVYNN